MANYGSITSVITEKLYPVVAESLNKNTPKFKKAIGDFINKNSKQIYDVGPYDNIYYTASDRIALLNSLNLTDESVSNIMRDCFFWDQPYNPGAAKEPYVLVCMMAIRYFLIKKQSKDAQITAIYLAFSGKFYASLFTGVAFPAAPPSKSRQVMDYVINNMLTDKHSLKKEGNMFGAVRAMCDTWLETYGPTLKGKCDDDKVGELIQQLRDREKSFLINIAKLYYEAYENKYYLNYETDNLSPEMKDFRLTDNDSLKAARWTESTMIYITTNSVSLQICDKCKDENVKATEVKDIMEAVIGDKKNLDDLRTVISILICDFLRHYPGKDVNSVEFISYSIKMKPNTKDKYLLQLKEIILSWLDENSANYRRRKSRTATAISYYKSILTYITLTISNANK